MKKLAKKEFFDKVFRTRLIFITDAEPAEVEAYIKKRFKETIDLNGFEGMAFACSKHELKFYIVWMRDSSKYYTLTHEVLHLVEWRFKDIGVKYEGEQVTYYHEYWVRRLWREISNRRPTK